MDYGLTDKTAIVLGASRGLGAACAALLAEEGATVIAVSRSGAAPQALSEYGASRISGRALDLGDAAAVAEFCTDITTLGADIFVNNSGGPASGPARGQTTEAWLGAFSAMALPAYAIADAVLVGMESKGWGRIVTIGSSGIEAPIPNLALSNAIRGAIAGWSKTLAREVAGKGITVNMVLPGRIATDRLAELDGIKARAQDSDLASVQKTSIATIPVGRYGRPEEFAAAVAFLCSEGASYVTGSKIRVDGGMIAAL